MVARVSIGALPRFFVHTDVSSELSSGSTVSNVSGSVQSTSTLRGSWDLLDLHGVSVGTVSCYPNFDVAIVKPKRSL